MALTNIQTPLTQNGVALIEAADLGLRVRTVRKASVSSLLTPWRIIAQSVRQTSRIHTREILRNVSFSIKAGERVGLIGPNGAGKSTLLSLLNGALRHTSGSLKVRGQTHALINVRLGVKPRATGVENILLNGYRLGFDTARIRELIDEIQDFSELGDQINDPVSTYSAGMQLRLAFAIATSIAPDILLMDEWIGAGDHIFRKKAAERLQGVVQKSRALIIASHNEQLIREICNKLIYLKSGNLVFFGDVDEGYRQFNEG